jgi:hypothetical protein
MKSIFNSGAGLLAGTLLLAPALHADPLVFNGTSAKASLIELYSSEGCSSCPPAEAWLNDLKAAPGLWRDIFPVAFHVNYWDNLGWTDRFATPAFTDRQRDYAARLNQESVYTPEFIVDGREWQRSWLSRQVPDEAAAKQGELAFRFDPHDQKYSARYVAAAPGSGSGLTLNVALLGFGVVSNVEHGENGGQRLRHDFLALGFDSVPLDPGTDGAVAAGPREITSISGETPGAVVAWVSDSAGKILQITGGWVGQKPAP